MSKDLDDGYHGDLPTDDWNTADYVPSGGAVMSEGSVDGLVGSYIRGKPVLSAPDIAHFLNRGNLASNYTALDPSNPLKNYVPGTGAAWAGHKGGVNAGYAPALTAGYTGGPLETISFGFYNTRADIDPYYNNVAGSTAGTRRLTGFSAFSEEQREAARQAIGTWDELIAVKFVEKAPAQADINFMNTTTGPAQASAYLPYNYSPAAAARLAGDVAVNPAQASNQQFDEGEYGLTTLIHELGHSLGLEHPGRYNFGPGFSVTYQNGAEFYQDSNQYSIMSYWRANETGANHVDWTQTVLRYNSTPGVHDVLAIQRIYGADMETRSGDTVYGFNSNTGLDTFDFEKTPLPVITIWDAGGNDTIDVSGFDTPSLIDLNPGAFSSAGGTYLDEIPSFEETNAARVAAGLAPRTRESYDAFVASFGPAWNHNLMSDNIAIAYNAIIENAVGGSGDDILVANGAANRLDGGAGNDLVSYQTATSGVSVNLATGLVSGGAAGDVLISIEGVTGSRHNDVLTGSDGNNVLNGLAGNDIIYGRNGDDTIDGGEGNDQLFGDGGNDTIRGGEGNDTIMGGAGDDILFGDAGNDTLYGDAGNDVLDGGAGDDKLYGGAGADTFRFSDLGGYDTIVDFRRGQGDKIDLTGIDANASAEGHQDFTWVGTSAFSGNAGEVRIFTDRGSTIIAGDVNGDGVADFQINVGATAIRADDLILTVNVAA